MCATNNERRSRLEFEREWGVTGEVGGGREEVEMM